MRNDKEKIYPYFGNIDVEEMYVALKGSRKGISAFMEKAKCVACRINNSPRSAYVYKDEDALFEVFKSEMPEILEARKISCFGEIIQIIS